jgi:hypothetical protein
MYEIPLHYQIVNIVKVSTKDFIDSPSAATTETKVKAGRLSKNSARAAAVPAEIEQPYDMLFILTGEFTFYFYKHSHREGLCLVSTGCLVDVIGQKREHPYSVVVGAKNKFIALNLYENMVKIIPVEKIGGQV